MDNTIRKYKLPYQEEITQDLIKDLIERHRTEKARILKLKEYYKNNNQTIMNKTKTDTNKPNNKLAHGFARYITDSFCGYFVGEPIKYKGENEDLLEKVNDCLAYNDEAENNIALAQESSICGYTYEVLYVDQDSELRFKVLNTEEIIAVYDNTIEEKMQFVIRYYDIFNLEDEDIKEVVLYTKNEVVTYLLKYDNLIEISREMHYFGDVPIADYENNSYRIGDFEPVLSLIDAYDQANSDTANDFEYFTNALLVVSGVTMDETDEVGRPLNFKDNRVLNFVDPTSKAEYLIKDINDTALENYKNRLNEDIHRFTNVVNMSDQNFGGNLTGIAIKYKLTGMEYVTGIKEAKFKKGIMRRLELISAILGIKSNDNYLYTEIQPVFARNIPTNEEEKVNMAKTVYGLVSDETVLSMLPFVEDVQKEIEKITKEKEEKALEAADYQFNSDVSKDGEVDEEE